MADLTLAQASRRQRGDVLLETALNGVLDKLLEAAAEHFSEADTVGPEARRKLMPILKKYAKSPHPFRACVKDNRKRFGPRVNAVCAVLKDIIRGTTKWRGHPKSDHGTAGLSDGVGTCMVLDLDDDTFNIFEKLSQLDVAKILELDPEEEAAA